MGYKYVSLLGDKNFEKGFNVRGLGTAIYHNTSFAVPGADDSVEFFPGGLYDPYPSCYFQYDKVMADVPEWNLCQWATRYPFHDKGNTTDSFNYRFTDKGNNSYLYENRSKTLAVNTNTGEFTLGLKASECYVHGDRQDGQEWPHLLLEHDIGSAGRPTKQMSVKNMNSLKVKLDMQVDSFVDHMGNRANPGKHATICMLYLFVSYKPEGATSFQDMIWLGMTLFDNRQALCNDVYMVDEGSKESATGQYIFNIGSRNNYLSDQNNVWENGDIKPGKTASIDFEVLPHIERALAAAQAAGEMKDATMDNLYINGMYIGFENTGTYDIQMTFKNMDIQSQIYTRL